MLPSFDKISEFAKTKWESATWLDSWLDRSSWCQRKGRTRARFPVVWPVTEAELFLLPFPHPPPLLPRINNGETDKPHLMVTIVFYNSSLQSSPRKLPVWKKPWKCFASLYKNALQVALWIYCKLYLSNPSPSYREKWKLKNKKK